MVINSCMVSIESLVAILSIVIGVSSINSIGEVLLLLQAPILIEQNIMHISKYIIHIFYSVYILS